MSISSNSLPKPMNLLTEEIIKTKNTFSKKFKKQISLQNDNYKKEIYKK